MAESQSERSSSTGAYREGLSPEIEGGKAAFVKKR
ncbi:hypothetical protein QUF76_08040 [Desulfobacterales bacterium HSG16]|nr:hypothetical protein [Desulfobacterales bacterium HSG16]